MFVQERECNFRGFLFKQQYDIKNIGNFVFISFLCLLFFFIRLMIGVYRNWSVVGEYGQVYGDGIMSKLLMGFGGGSGGCVKDMFNNFLGKK